MRVAIFLCLLVAVCAGTTPYCCAPDQWEGTVSMTQGYVTQGHPPGVEMSTTQTHVDFINQREATVTSIKAAGVVTEFRIVKDYKLVISEVYEKTQYKIDSSSPGQCTKTPLPYPMARTCADSAATRLSPERYGGGADTALVDNYILQSPGITQMFAFTRQLCLPFTRTLWGTEAGVSTLQFYTYTNVTDGIKDPSVFSLPTTC